MTSLNLTATEAADRSRLITVSHYDITIDLTQSPERFGSRTQVSFSTHEPGSSFIDLRTDVAPTVSLDGVELDMSAYSATEGIQLPELSVGEHTLVVDATILFSHTGQGLHRAVDNADGKAYMYTQFESADAKRMFACFDQPDMKATYDITVIADPAWRVITNTPMTAQPGEAATIHHGTIDYPLSTYLVALAAGEYAQVTDTWRGTLTHHPETPADQPTDLEIPLALYCRASLLPHLDAERIFTETKQGFDFYHRNFGMAYPFGKYDQLFVPEFNMGAMEHPGAVTIRDEYIFASQATHYRYERRADTILHEMAHMWFGDLVTMRWWGDLWLNESFATWAAATSQAEETQYDTAWVTFANVEKAWAYSQDQLPTTHPVSTDASDIETVEQNFDGITYAKGASVLKQLHVYVGREAFFAGVRAHFARHAFGNATFADLLDALAEASGRDLSFWADQWLKTTGVNHLRFDRATSQLIQTGDTLRTHRLAVGAYNLVDGAVVRVGRVELDVDGPTTPVEGIDTSADLIIPNDDDLTYALIDLDEQSLRFVVDHIDQITDPMARTLCWSAAWEMTRSGALPARQFVALVARGARAETELGVLERILSQAATAQRRYADPAWAAESTLLADALLNGARTASPEAALVFEQALAQVPLTDEAADYLRGLLDSTDNDQAWRAVTALVARRDADEDAIDALAARDTSSTGVLAALKARAARPSAKVKQEVWHTIVNGGLTNLQSRHLLAGLTFSDDDLADLSAPFFDVAESVWRDQSSEVAVQVLTGLYPRWDISEEAITRATAFLERDLAGGLRRIVAEGLDATRRSLRLRAVDAGQ